MHREGFVLIPVCWPDAGIILFLQPDLKTAISYKLQATSHRGNR
jgi:hypothetical protein